MQLPGLNNVRDPATQLLIERLTLCFVVIAGILVMGTLGYVWIEGWPVADAFYMTVITMATVGYGETRELSAVGRLFTTGLIFLSIVSISCWTACITTAFVSRELTGTFAAKRIRKMVNALQGHTVIFGANIMAETIMLRIIESGTGVVVVEENHLKVDDFRRRYPEALVIESPPANEMALFDSNINAAGSAVVCMDSDFDNLLVAISIKELNPGIRVIARANDPKVASRMMKIGVNEVICPFQLSGEYVANLIENRITSDCVST